ncbi:MAG: N-acetylgalactosamine-6-sulfatase, partial [Verrucomicrobia bacterium]|nr:N-acetylgalactosamine-6-sulfatase [Verrucomicrobiota bacterium]
MRTVALLAYLLFSLHLFGQNESNKPNIILFLVDDMGLMDTSVPMLVDKEGKPQ